MADPKKSYNDIITWAKGTSNDIIAKKLATPRSISITNNAGTSLASGNFDGSANVTLKLPALVPVDISGNAATATTATKLGSNAGTGKIPIYFSGGKPVACGTELSVTADKAKQLAAAKSITLTGAVTGSGNFDGSANVSIPTTLSQQFCTTQSGGSSIVISGTYKDANYPNKAMMPAYDTQGYLNASKNYASINSPLVVVEFRRFYYSAYKSDKAPRANITGFAFYRKWSDGWIEQGGSLECQYLYTDSVPPTLIFRLMFPVSFADTPYICFCNITGNMYTADSCGGVGNPGLDYPTWFCAYHILRDGFDTSFQTAYKVTSNRYWYAAGY